MSPTAPAQCAPRPAGPPAAGDLLTDLEWFWPSRRGHAYDEFCRAEDRSGSHRF